MASTCLFDTKTNLQKLISAPVLSNLLLTNGLRFIVDLRVTIRETRVTSLPQSAFTMFSQALENLHILVIGGSGLVGSHFLREAQNCASVKNITVLSRRDMAFFHDFDKVRVVIEPETLKWCTWIQESKTIDVLFSALGSTRGDAGSITKQKSIDYDLNLMVAQQAKLKGAKVYVLVSCFNNFILSSVFPYFSLKQQVENAMCSLNFDTTVFLRPGPLLGDRTHTIPNHTLRSILSTYIAEITYDTPFSCLVGGAIKAREVAEVAMFMIETSKHLNRIAVVTSAEMLQLERAIESL